MTLNADPHLLFQRSNYITKYHYMIFFDMRFHPSLNALISSVASTRPKIVLFIERFYSSIVGSNAVTSVLCRASIRTHLNSHSILWSCSVYPTSKRQEKRLRFARWMTLLTSPSTSLTLQGRKARFYMVNQRLPELWAEVIAVNAVYSRECSWPAVGRVP